MKTLSLFPLLYIYSPMYKQPPPEFHEFSSNSINRRVFFPEIFRAYNVRTSGG